jgi:hypothetical protein
MKRITFSLILLGLVSLANAQEIESNGTPKDKKYGLVIGYYGNKLTEAGVQVGLENYLATTANFQVVSSLHLNIFRKKDIHTGLSLNPRIGVRHTANWGLTMEGHLGLGYLHRFFDYDQYKLDESGVIVKQGKAGQASLMPNIAFGLGYDFSRTFQLPVALYLRPSVNWAYPNKHFGFEASYAAEVGIVVKL